MPNQRYLVTARKYRPTLFRELVAQEHVTETLENAILLDRLAHAYLFSGPRGVGKTTAARILAKAINCTTPLEERDGAEPCRQCTSCRSFEDGRSLNIIEIDAASNNKVDDIRELRESVRIPPQGSRKKVYIVDEVHMLSNAAFNALLKTLEEPPPHVLFIFATTEPNKVLPTILSRCQRFDFRRIPVPEIVARLQEICRAEAITADDAALLLIARKGDGALRDALSAFDQAVSLCGTDLHYAELAKAMGVVEVDLFFEVTDSIETGNSAAMLRLVDRIVRSGYDLQEFLGGLAEHLRNVLVARTMQDASLIEATERMRQRYIETSARLTEPDLLRLLTIVDDAQEAIKSSTQPRLKLELALLKMASLAHVADLRQVLQHIDRLEKLARKGKLPADLPPQTSDHATAAEAAPPSTSSAAAQAPAGDAAAGTTYTAPDEAPTVREPATADAAKDAASTPPPADDQPSHRTAVDTPTAEAKPATDEDKPAADEPLEPPAAANEAGDEPPTPPTPSIPPLAKPDAGAGSPEPARPYATLFGQPALAKKTKPSDTNGGSPEAHQTGDGAVAVAELPGAAAPAEAPSASPLLARIQSVWPRCVQAVMEARKRVGACLQDASPVNVRGEQLCIAVPSNFHRQFLRSEHRLVLKHIRAHIDIDVHHLNFTLQKKSTSISAPSVQRNRDPKEILQQKRSENPALHALLEQFGGEIVW